MKSGSAIVVLCLISSVLLASGCKDYYDALLKANDNKPLKYYAELNSTYTNIAISNATGWFNGTLTADKFEWTLELVGIDKFLNSHLHFANDTAPVGMPLAGVVPPIKGVANLANLPSLNPVESGDLSYKGTIESGDLNGPLTNRTMMDLAWAAHINMVATMIHTVEYSIGNEPLNAKGWAPQAIRGRLVLDGVDVTDVTCPPFPMPPPRVPAGGPAAAPAAAPSSTSSASTALTSGVAMALALLGLLA